MYRQAARLAFAIDQLEHTAFWRSKPQGGPDPRGRGWQEFDDLFGHRWTWADPIGVFYVFEDAPQGTYSLAYTSPAGVEYAYKAPFRQVQNAYSQARSTWDGMSSGEPSMRGYQRTELPLQ